MPHERVDPAIVASVTINTAAPEDEHDQIAQHRQDEDTTWLGLDQDSGGEPVLAEYRRYAALMMQNRPDSQTVRYPALVSFIGQTGKAPVLHLWQLAMLTPPRCWQKYAYQATD